MATTDAFRLDLTGHPDAPLIVLFNTVPAMLETFRDTFRGRDTIKGTLHFTYE